MRVTFSVPGEKTGVYRMYFMKLPMIDISSFREQIPTTQLTSPSIHILTNITGIFFRSWHLRLYMPVAFPLKTGTAIIHLDSPFSPPQYQRFFIVVMIYLYSQDFFWDIHTYIHIKYPFFDISAMNLPPPFIQNNSCHLNYHSKFPQRYKMALIKTKLIEPN